MDTPKVLVYLVQRIRRKPKKDENRKGVDALFTFDYMGSSEFEFGAKSKALQKMRSAGETLYLYEIGVQAYTGGNYSGKILSRWHQYCWRWPPCQICFH